MDSRAIYLNMIYFIRIKQRGVNVLICRKFMINGGWGESVVQRDFLKLVKSNLQPISKLD